MHIIQNCFNRYIKLCFSDASVNEAGLWVSGVCDSVLHASASVCVCVCVRLLIKLFSCHLDFKEELLTLHSLSGLSLVSLL